MPAQCQRPEKGNGVLLARLQRCGKGSGGSCVAPLPLEHPFASFGDDSASVDLEGLADAEEGVERRIPGIRLQSAYQRLTQTGLLGQRITGNSPAFSLGNEEFYDFGADFVMDDIFYHP